jgi:hypothetical protein
MSTLEKAARFGTPVVGQRFAGRGPNKDNAPVEVVRHTPGTSTVTVIDVDGPAWEANDPRTIRVTTLYNQYSLVEANNDKEDDDMAKTATAPKEAPKAAAREKRQLKKGQVWERRSDGAQVELVAIEGDEDTGRVKLKTVDTERETDSALKFFRRRFKFVKDAPAKK